MINLWKSHVKPCVNSCRNYVHFFVDFSHQKLCAYFSAPFFAHFKHSFHPLLRTPLLSVLIKTFSLFHKPYYYYNNILINNNI